MLDILLSTALKLVSTKNAQRLKESTRLLGSVCGEDRNVSISLHVEIEIT